MARSLKSLLTNLGCEIFGMVLGASFGFCISFSGAKFWVLGNAVQLNSKVAFTSCVVTFIFYLFKLLGLRLPPSHSQAG